MEDWKFIASIPKGAKPCFYDKTFVYTNEWFVTLRRRYKGEKAERGIDYVDNLIKETKYKNMDKKSLNVLRELLINSISGLDNLSQTYKEDGQMEIAISYLALKKQVKEMIKEIDFLILSKNTFFCHTPNLL